MSTQPHAAVIPLQRAEADLPRRPDSHAAPQPPSTDVAFWDAETEAMWAGTTLTRHGRRCACCRPALAGAVEAVS